MLPEGGWHEILVTIESMPRQTNRPRAIYHPTRWIFQLMFHTYSRIGDVATLRMRNFSRGPNRWSVHLVGKGKLATSIISTKNLMSELAVYRRHLDLSPSPKSNEPLPAVLPYRLRRLSNGEIVGLTEQSIYVVWKGV